MEIKYLIIACLSILLSSFIIGEAAWYINDKKNGGVAMDNSSYVNITVKYADVSLSKSANTTSYSGSTKDLYNKYLVYYNSGLHEHISTSDITESIEDDTYVYSYTETYRKITKCSVSGFISKKYSITGTDYIVTHTKKIIPDSMNVYYQYTIKNGQKLNRPNINRSGYELTDFYLADTTGYQVTSNTFNFDESVTKSQIIYAAWNKVDSSTETLTSYVSNLKSTGNVSNGYGANANYYVYNDPTYSFDSNTVNLGATTIVSGATLNLCKNDGLVHYESLNGQEISDSSLHISSTDTYVSLDNNVKNYTVVLTGDLTINGNLYIGGYTGNASKSYQGYIIKDYVEIDLNGYTITINEGGMLHSFGNIKNSKETGSIIVNPGGNLKTQLVCADLKGGNHTLWAYSKGISPFQNYLLPYLNCKVELIGGGSNSGQLDVFTKFNLGSLGLSNIYIPFFGGTSNYFIQFNSKDDKPSKIILDVEEIDVLKKLDNVVTYNCAYIKNNVSISNSNIIVNSINLLGKITVDIPIIGSKTVNYDLSLDRVDFPISTHFDYNFINSNIKLLQSLIIMPGATFNFDKDSILTLDYYKNSENTQIEKNYDSVTVYTKTLPGQTKYLSGSISVYDKPMYGKESINAQNNPNLVYGVFTTEYKDYWDYFQGGVVNVYGKINFITGNNYSPYELAGNININSYMIDGNNSKTFNITNLKEDTSNINLKTYKLDCETVGGFWFNSSNITSSSNASSYISANYFYARPLISNNIAYILDDNMSLSGTYNSIKEIFTDEVTKKTYFMYCENELLDTNDTSKSEYQEKKINNSIVLTECIVDDVNHVIVSGENEYILYAGIYFKLTSRNSNTAVVNLTKLSTNTSVDYSLMTVKWDTTYNVWKIS